MVAMCSGTRALVMGTGDEKPSTGLQCFTGVNYGCTDESRSSAQQQIFAILRKLGGYLQPSYEASQLTSGTYHATCSEQSVAKPWHPPHLLEKSPGSRSVEVENFSCAELARC